MSELWLWVVRRVGGLHDIGALGVGIFDDGLAICWRRVVKWELRIR